MVEIALPTNSSQPAELPWGDLSDGAPLTLVQ